MDRTPQASEGEAAERARVCLGVVAGVRGLKGQVWIRSFAAVPEDVAAYGPLSDSSGARSFHIHVVESAGERVLARIEGVCDRTAAERLKGEALFVARDRLPPPGEDEFYHADLIGLAVELQPANDGPTQPAGRVRAVHDYGAGPVLEVAGGPFGTLMAPFTKAAAPIVDLAAGRLVIARLPGLLDAGDGADDEAAGAAEGGR